MVKQIARNAFRRRGFEVHMTKLFELRRSHGHSSFFDADGYIRDYAYRYLCGWLSQDLPPGGDVPKVHRDASSDCTLETIRDHLTPECREAALFREVLQILDQDGPVLFDGDAPHEVYDAQMEEFARAYTVVDSLRWDRSEDDDNVVHLKSWE